MKLLKLLEKNSCEDWYCALEKRDDVDRGFGKLIHVLPSIPKTTDGLLKIMSFEDFLEDLVKNPVDDLYFTGAAIYAYKKFWRFRLYIKNRGLTRYFKDTSNTDIEDSLVAQYNVQKS